jgi:hypothetical protein
VRLGDRVYFEYRLQAIGPSKPFGYRTPLLDSRPIYELDANNIPEADSRPIYESDANNNKGQDENFEEFNNLMIQRNKAESAYLRPREKYDA